MTADPYPTDLLDEEPFGSAAPPHEPPGAVSIDAGTREQVRALNRIATALEQLVLERVPNTPGRQLAALPPVQTTAPQTAPQGGVCPIHNVPWKVVPAGVSKKTGKPYDAFQACSVGGCDQRPPR
jgi:hypothetical protein